MMIHGRMIEFACLTILMTGFTFAQEKNPPGDQPATSLQTRDEVLERRLKQLEVAKLGYRKVKDARLKSPETVSEEILSRISLELFRIQTSAARSRSDGIEAAFDFLDREGVTQRKNEK